MCPTSKLALTQIFILFFNERVQGIASKTLLHHPWNATHFCFGCSHVIFGTEPKASNMQDRHSTTKPSP